MISYFIDLLHTLVLLTDNEFSVNTAVKKDVRKTELTIKQFVFSMSFSLSGEQ